MNEKITSNVNVRYLYQAGELEGRAKSTTDPFWSFKICTLESATTKPDEPVIYYLQDGPNRGFAREDCWLCPQIHSFRQLSVDCLIATFHRGSPLLAREWVNIVRHELFSYRASSIFPAPPQLFQELADQLFWVADMRGLVFKCVASAHRSWHVGVFIRE